MTTPIKLALLAVVALAQLYVPYHMIRAQELVLAHGTRVKFWAGPIDPSDPFRGRYVRLSFERGYMPHPKQTQLPLGQHEAYVVVQADPEGYAELVDITLEAPKVPNYFDAKIQVNREGMVHINYPFNRFYMEESAAPRAERVYWEQRQEGRRDTYVVVRVLDGAAVIEDLYVNDMPIYDYLRAIAPAA